MQTDKKEKQKTDREWKVARECLWGKEDGRKFFKHFLTCLPMGARRMEP
jgi:hypothetical protein